MSNLQTLETLRLYSVKNTTSVRLSGLLRTAYPLQLHANVALGEKAGDLKSSVQYRIPSMSCACEYTTTDIVNSN